MAVAKVFTFQPFKFGGSDNQSGTKVAQQEETEDRWQRFCYTMNITQQIGNNKMLVVKQTSYNIIHGVYQGQETFLILHFNSFNIVSAFPRFSGHTSQITEWFHVQWEAEVKDIFGAAVAFFVIFKTFTY